MPSKKPYGNTGTQNGSNSSPTSRLKPSSEDRNQSGYTLTDEEADAMLDRIQKTVEEGMLRRGRKIERLPDGTKRVVRIK